MEANKGKDGDSDRLMELPEAILHHIFSSLPMKDVIKTSVLAKRWRYVWLYVPCLNFPPTVMATEKELAFINRSLVLHKALVIDKLSIAFGQDSLEKEYCDSVESWIMFAATRNVKELRLSFSGIHQVSPQCVFKCGSLTVLELKMCSIKTPDEFRLNSLKSLSLEEICWDHANALLAASPNVERLSLINCCDSDEKIDLFIMNSSLKTLTIKDCECLSDMEVCAPFVTNFDLSVSMSMGICVLSRMKSLQSVTLGSLDFEYILHWWYSEGYRRCNAVKKILEDVCHVKDLKLSSSCIKAISTIEEKMEGSLSFSCTHLELRTGLTTAEIATIVSILELSPNVQTLIICIEETEKARIPGGLDKILQKTGIANVLKKLETIKVNDFMKNLSDQTKVSDTKVKHYTTEELASQLEDDFSFLKLLLENSPVLKSMTIGVGQNLRLGQSKMTQLQLLTHERLQAFPRASRDAVVSFRVRASPIV